MSKGILIYAYNNTLIPYLEMALGATSMIQANLSVKNVTVVTDKGSYNRLSDKHKAIADNLFDHVIFQEPERKIDKENTRVYKDTDYHKERAPWHNTTRNTAYELSPYDETVLLDADYLVQSNWIDLLWNSEEEIMINKKIVLLNEAGKKERTINPFSIPLYWATVVFFRKGRKADLFFSMVSHIKENYNYYRLLYDFRGGLYRNDIVFSIAVHTLSGFLEPPEFNSLPFHYLYSTDRDELVEVEKGSLKFLVGGEISTNFIVSNVKGMDVHVTNKFSVCRKINQILEIYYDN